MRLPGRWVRAAAAWLWGKRTMERVIDPVVADLQMEYEETMRTRHRWRAIAVRFRGYAGLWKALSLHTLESGPRLLWNGIAADDWALGRTIGYSLIVFLSAALLLSAWPMASFYSRTNSSLTLTLLLLPQAIPLSIPIALPLGIVAGLPGRHLAARRVRGILVLAIVAMSLTFAAVLIIPAANQAFRVTVAQDLSLAGITKYSLPRGMNELSRSELASRSHEYDAAGLARKAREFRHTYHMRLALPAATGVLTLFAVGVCGTVRGRVRRVTAIVAALGAYWAILVLAGGNPILPPELSAWLPNILFLACSVPLLSTAHRSKDQ